MDLKLYLLSRARPIDVRLRRLDLGGVGDALLVLRPAGERAFRQIAERTHDETGTDRRDACDDKYFPPGVRAGRSGLVMILPQLEQQALYDKFNFQDGGPWKWGVSPSGDAAVASPLTLKATWFETASPDQALACGLSGQCFLIFASTCSVGPR